MKHLHFFSSLCWPPSRRGINWLAATVCLLLGLWVGPVGGAHARTAAADGPYRTTAAPGPGHQPAAGQPLADALNADGTLKPGLSGSFDPRGYVLGTAPNGQPAFRPAGARRTQSAGDENWQNGFGLPGTNNTVNTVVRTNTGEVYIGGSFSVVSSGYASSVAKWNGTTWTPLGTGMNNTVYALAVDGSGNLYAGGTFTQAGGVAANRIAKWNGTTWSPLGTGVNSLVSALAVDGSGNLYAGGTFTQAGEAAANRIAKWNGTTWSPLGTGMNSNVNALAVDGNGNVYVGGNFTQAGGAGTNYVARWNGTAWSPLGVGIDNTVHALAVDGSGNVYVGGSFTQAGGAAANYVARWNGTRWSPLGTGANGAVTALAMDGSGNVYAGGYFTQAGGAGANYVARWNGTTWSPLGAGVSSNVTALAVDGSGNLYAGGTFIHAGGAAANRIAKWNGTTWSPLGTGVNSNVNALAMDGSGNVYAGGTFIHAGGAAANRIAKWNGTTWSPLGTGMNSDVNTLAIDGSGNLYAGGTFTLAGGAAANYVAKWNGTTWSPLGTGVNGNVTALAIDGSGNVYAGGYFTQAGGAAANRIAKWNGTTWSPLGTGLIGNVTALAVDGGTVYAGGTFTQAGAVTANFVAKWDGAAWSSLGAGVNSLVSALAVDGSGNVYAGGIFTQAGGATANRVAKWNGTTWSPLGTGLGDAVNALATDGRELYAGGTFTTVGDASKVTAYFGIYTLKLAVTTTAPTSLTSTGATLGGIAASNDGEPVTEYGVVYVPSNGTPTTSDTKVLIGTGLGSFSQAVTGLSSATTYTVRAYAINSLGTVYGSSYTFTTLALPPTLTALSPGSGRVGTSVTLTGTNFTGATTVRFNGVAATAFTVVNSTTITATVPSGGSTGLVTVTTAEGTASSPGNFTVLPYATPPSLVVSGTPVSYGGAATLTARPNLALKFDGVDDYVATGFNVSPAALPTTTWEAWVYPTRVNHAGGQQTIFSTDNGGWDRAVNLLVNSSNFGVATGSASTFTVAAPADLNQWQHLAVVYTGSTVTFYKNGVQTYTGPTNFDAASNSLAIGKNPGFGEFFQGQLDEVRVWNTARSQADIQATMYAAPAGSTAGLTAFWRFNEASGTTAGNEVASGGAGTLTAGPAYVTPGQSSILTSAFAWSPAATLSATNTANVTARPIAITTYTVTVTDHAGNETTAQQTLTPTYSAPPSIMAWGPTAIAAGGSVLLTARPNLALRFDGVDDYVNTTLTVSPTALPTTTWEAWVYPTRVNHAGGQQTIFSTDDGGWDRAVNLLVNSSNFGVATGSGFAVAAPADANEWQHLAVVYTGSTVTFYKNGVQTYTGPTNFDAASNPLAIGKNPGFGEFFQGQLDEVRVWNTARSQADIQANMYEAPAGSTAGLTAFWRFNGGSTTTAINEVNGGVNGISIGIPTYVTPGQSSIELYDFVWSPGTGLNGTTATARTMTVTAAPTTTTTYSLSVSGSSSARSTTQLVTVTAPLVLTSTSPARHAIAAPRNQALSLTFDDFVQPASASNVRVFSSQRGGQLVRGGNATASGNTLTVAPAQALKPGETVSVTVPANVTATDGRPARPQVYQFTAATTGGSGRFVPATPVSVALGASPNAVAVGDLNNDGTLDIVAGNSGSLGALINNGTGSFTAGSALPTTPAGTVRTVALADMNNDGYLDLLTANGNVNIHLNDGAGGLTNPAPNGVIVMSETISYLAVGDVDGDGDLDVLAVGNNASGNTGVASTRFNDGNGNFAPSTVQVAVDYNSTSPTLGDIDGDGDLDLITVSNRNTSSAANIRLNDGHGNFSIPTANAGFGLGGSAGGCALGDVDGDGDLDIVAAVSDLNKVIIRLNDGQGVFSNPAIPEVNVGNLPRSLKLGDVDGDGDLDILTCHSSTVDVCLNNGQGGFTRSSITNALPQNAFALAIDTGDLDGDGDLDFVAGDYSNRAVSIHLNQALTPSLTSANPTSAQAGATISLTGTNLTGATTITFAGTSGNTVTSGFTVNAAGTQITGIVVPSGATTGNVTVTTPNGTSNTLVFNALPAITSFSPASGPIGTTLVISGTGFTNIVSVAVGGCGLPLTSFTVDSPTQITAVVGVACTGPVRVTYGTGQVASTQSFTVTPQVTSFSPASGPVGSAVVITCTGGTGTVPSAVQFNGTTAAFSITNMTATYFELTATVPAGATTGPITVTRGGLNASSASNFTVTTSGVATLAMHQNGTEVPAGGYLFADQGVGTSSAPIPFTLLNTGTAPLNISGITFTGPFALSGPAPTTIAAGASAAVNVVFTPPAAGTLYPGTLNIASNAQNGNTYWVELRGMGVLTDLVVTTPLDIQGSYRNVTITGTGRSMLLGPLQVAGTLTVQSGGYLNTGYHAVFGPGSFRLEAGAELAIADPAGISASGATGAVQVSGTRSFSADADYSYNGLPAQVTGSGLPAQVRNLTSYSPLTLSQPVAIRQVLTLEDGDLTLNGHPLTLLSDANGTALVVNSGTGVVRGGTATVQRYLAPSRNPGPGYRHYSSPVSGNTLADLNTTGFTPAFNPAYNTAAQPNMVTPFPTIFGYNQTRLATTTNNLGMFDKGWFSPAATDSLPAGTAYTVHLPGTAKVDFTGRLRSGNYTLSLGRNAGSTAPDAGWALVGNPYPAPLDWSLVAPTDRPGLDAAMYVFESTGPYAGQYRTFLPGVSDPALVSPFVASSQGFFVRVSPGQTSGSLTFRNAHRLTSYDIPATMRRSSSGARPTLGLTLTGTTGLTDELLVHTDATATAGLDAAADTVKLPNTTGLNLAALAATGEQLAIDGRPAFAAATSIPLFVGVPAAGSYTLTAATLANLTGTRVELVDNLTNTRTLLTAGTNYAFTMTGYTTPGRFWLNLTPASAPLATAAALEAQVLVYPNPAQGQLTVLRPTGPATTATLLNSLGQTVRTLALPTTETRADLRGLAAGIYSLRLTIDGQPVTKRIVVQ